MFRAAATLLVITLLFCINTIYAQTMENSIKQTINQLFTALKSADAAGLKACFADSAVLQTIEQKNNTTTIRSEQVNNFAASIGKLQKGDADERITYDVVKWDGELAIVLAPYQFYYKGTFSHCGTDSFQLVCINGVWKIVYVIDTRRKEGCA